MGGYGHEGTGHLCVSHGLNAEGGKDEVNFRLAGRPLGRFLILYKTNLFHSMH